MNVPRNVLRFEVLLYLSLMLDAFSLAFEDRTPGGEVTERVILIVSLLSGAMILLLVYFVWLAARKRKNWPRWALAALLGLSVITLGQAIAQSGVDFESAVEVVSCALTAAGLYFSFSGDAKGWFNA